MSFDHRTSERVRAVIKSQQISSDDDTIEYIASLIVDDLRDSKIKTANHLFDCISDTLIRLV
jgi:hypothetical protein